MSTAEEMVAVGNAIRVLALDLIDAHEKEDHGGKRCSVERVNVVAFLAHALGVDNQGELLSLIERVVELRHNHNAKVRENT